MQYRIFGWENANQNQSRGILETDIVRERKIEMKNTAIVLAAGQGKRMHTKIQKQFLEIKGYPVLYYSLRCFQDSPLIEDIILVTGEESVLYCQKEIVDKYGFTKVTKVIPGGKERYDSVYQGLLACENSDYVLIHDGARPFVNQEIIRRCMLEVPEYQACVVGMPVKDTIKIADEGGYAKQTPDRKNVWMIQTPQTFSYALIYEAYEEMLKTEDTAITDDAMVLERIKGKKSKLIEGSYRNIKITTPEDLLIANVYLQHPE